MTSFLLLCLLFLAIWCACIESSTATQPASVINNIVTVPIVTSLQGTTTAVVEDKTQKTKRSKRKRVKAKVKKWLSGFSKLDHKNNRVLTYYGMMLAGAIARSASATAVHPLNVIKTRLQTKEGKMPEFTWKSLTRGAGMLPYLTIRFNGNAV